jgi:hypothetical protein
MAFRVGQKVTRIALAFEGDLSVQEANEVGASCPAVGEVVTIKTINQWRSETLLTFHEHDNSHIQRMFGDRYEPGFNAECFRPLTERSTEAGMAILRSYLVTANGKVEA